MSFTVFAMSCSVISLKSTEVSGGTSTSILGSKKIEATSCCDRLVIVYQIARRHAAECNNF